MRAPQRLRSRGTLAGRMLRLQLLIIGAVLLCVAAVSIAQSNSRFHETEGRRALVVAQGVTQSPGVLEYFGRDGASHETQARSAVENSKALSDSTEVSIVGLDGARLFSTDPDARDQPAVPRTAAFDGRGWIGDDPATGSAMAMAPIFNPDTRETVAVAVVTRAYPTVLDNLEEALPNLLTYLGIASIIGVFGSLLLSRRVKRETLGLEPIEIAGLVEQREAVLHGIKEGLLAVDSQGRVTLLNDEAARLLDLPQAGAVGRHLDALDPSRRVSSIVTDTASVAERVEDFAGRLVTLNVRPVVSHGRPIGRVATLRDRTELLELQRELDLTRTTTDSLRAQAHEFSNRMHVITGLIDLGEYDDVGDYVRRISADEEQLTARVGNLVADPAVSALILAKSRQATERGVEFVVDEDTRIGRLPGDLSTDVNTIVGNLVDNALDAAAASPNPKVTVELSRTEGGIRIIVRDNGPGVDQTLGESVFSRGVSTKGDGAGEQRGIGLALVRRVCERHGGSVSNLNDHGAVFVAELPIAPDQRW